MNYNKDQLNSDNFKFSKPKYYEEDPANNVEAGYYSKLDDKQKDYNKKLIFLQHIGAADSYDFIPIDETDAETNDKTFTNTFTNIVSNYKKAKSKQLSGHTREYQAWNPQEGSGGKKRRRKSLLKKRRTKRRRKSLFKKKRTKKRRKKRGHRGKSPKRRRTRRRRR